jgi:hypothetical protein
MCVALFMVGCKSSFIASKTEEGRARSSEEVYDRIINNTLIVDGFRGKIRASLIQPSSKKEVTLSVRYAKDQGLLFSAPLGMAKALITPEKLAYYNKLNRTYFEGSFKDLDSLLPITFSFDQLQRLFNAEIVFAKDITGIKETKRVKRAMNKMQYTARVNSADFGNAVYEIVVQLNPTRVLYQELISNQLKTPVVIVYTYENKGSIPTQIELSGAGKTLLLYLSDFESQKAMSLPFQIPSGYRRALIK